MSLLEMIKSPADLHNLKRELLPQLVNEIRNTIVDTCSKTGGHVAGSLGAVELITALHYTFESPKDRIVFDVGHQAYAHKILTGRWGRFSTNRQYGGISGFPKISESEHDAFGTGHASTSISAAFGMACARDMKGGNYRVVAVIGDGALSGGLAYEGLNNAGSSGKDMLVILNDNSMFISPRVGAVGKMLTKLFTLGVVKKTEESLVNLLKKTRLFGLLGMEMLKTARRLKSILFPSMFFEELGFSCFGPIDGNNLDNLILVLSKIKKFSGPVFLHVMTKKGMGYAPAEKNPEKFHGLSSFAPATGETPPSKRTYSSVFGETMVELAKKYDDLVVVTAAMTEGTGLSEFAKKFPERFFDCGIAEEHAVTFAAGLASRGVKPVVAVYSTFLQRSLDQIIHDVCLQELPVVFAADRAGIVGDDGPTHHGNFDVSYLRLIPNIIVCAPKDENEFRNLLYSSLEYSSPAAVRYPRAEATGVKTSGDFTFIPYGQSEVLKTGKDVCIAALGSMVYPSMLVASQLEARGVSCGVINARFAKPVDIKALNEAASGVKLLVTCEENTVCGGFGAAVLENIAVEFRRKVRLIAIPDRFITHGEIERLKKDAGIDAKSIFDRIEGWLQ